MEKSLSSRFFVTWNVWTTILNYRNEIIMRLIWNFEWQIWNVSGLVVVLNDYATSQWLSCQQIFQTKQECIPVGCVPPARYHTGGSLSGGVCVQGVCVQGSLCPGGLCQGWVSVQGGSLSWGPLSGGLCLVGGLCPGGLCLGGSPWQRPPPPPVSRITDTCKTFPF